MGHTPPPKFYGNTPGHGAQVLFTLDSNMNTPVSQAITPEFGAQCLYQAAMSPLFTHTEWYLDTWHTRCLDVILLCVGTQAPILGH